MTKPAHRLVVWVPISIAFAAALFYMHGAKMVLVVGLILVCARLNAMFLAAPLSALKHRDAKSIATAAGALLANVTV